MATYHFKSARRISVFLISLIFASFLCSCFYVPSKKQSVYYNDRTDLLLLFRYTVPFVSDGRESVGDIEIYPVEIDDYGRTLGTMQGDAARNHLLFGENAVYCVLQSGSKKESCFYEDICCVMVENGTGRDDAIERLKQNNDWNQPIAYEKCRRIPIKYDNASGAYDMDLGYEYNSLLRNACNAVGWSKDNAWLDEVCKDGQGLWLFALVLDPSKTDSPVCLVMMKEIPRILANAEPELSVVGSHRLENRTSPWEEIRDFKIEMGWTFADSPKGE